MGKGLSAILPRTRAEETGLREVPVELIEPNPQQPRREFDEEALLALSESIQSRGLLQPVVVRPLAGGKFELIAGERRLRASKIAGLASVPAVIRQAEDSERLDLALAENMARVDLNPVEEARACSMLVDDLGLSKAEVGRRVGKSRVAVSNLIRLLELPDDVLDPIAAGILTEAHGRAILTCKDHDGRKRLGREAREQGWSVRETERRARELESGGPAKRPASEPHPDLVEALAATEDARTKGERVRVEIEFDSVGEAQELAEQLVEARRGTIRAA
jgi:ParB family transcriptional regulator, chromosome partitioning protein